MGPGAAATMLQGMRTYPVVWRERSAERVSVGRLELDKRGITLSGGRAGARLRFEIAYEELARVVRDRRDRLGTAPALRLELLDGRTLLLAALTGIGLLTEIHERLAAQQPANGPLAYAGASSR
jgi:hypothetical protein